ncbi:MAG TPA: sulfatase-like hydrolase/transferase [Thermoleophilaceae bacterium]|nr:sulfatase-like hydrolase/transferase [Thermoleophilaceae bacterium]
MRVRSVLLAALAAALVPACGGSDGGRAAVPEKPPVVVLILDEFPADTLLRPDGSIDAERYPHFADLAGRSTWFPNAYTIYDSTFKSVPAIMDAVLPKRGTAADFRSHRHSLYTLFDRLGYEFVDVESGEALCPPRICPGARTRRPGVLKRLAGSGRPPRMNAWIGAIRRRDRPTLYLQHALLPHEPWIYLPSGRQSRPKGNDPIPKVNGPKGFHDAALTNHNETRHLLQVGFVDRQVGRLMDRLRRTGLLDEAAIVVTADHGYAFEVGVSDRRLVTESNVDEIAPVPLFIKAPGQTEGEVDEGLVRTLDILPTLADLLDVRIDWRHDGHSAFAPATRRRRVMSLPTRDFSEVIRIGRGELERRRRANRRRRARLVGTGAESNLLFGSPWEALYRVGSHPELMGRKVGGNTTAAPGVRASVANADLLSDVSAEDEIIPTRVTGTLEGGPPEALRDVAVAVNGTVWATGRSFRLRGRPFEYFSLIVPEHALRPGRNAIELFEVGPGGRLSSLYRSG